MKDISNEDDIRESRHATRSQSRVLRIEQGRTPIYLLDSKYEDGFAHWVQLPSGDRVRIACGGGTDGGGYAPDVCPICGICKEEYRRARSMEQSGRKASAVQLRGTTNRMKGKYEMYFLAAKGELNVSSLEGGKKRFSADFEDAQVGLLSLTKKQRDDLLAAPNELSHLSGKDDLLNRYIIFDKKVRGEDDFATIEFQPAKKPTPVPKVEWDADEINLEGLFNIDEEELERVTGIILGGGDEQSEVDYEDAEAEEVTEQIEAEPEEEELGEDFEKEGQDVEEETPSDAENSEIVEDAVEEDATSSTFDNGFLDDVDDFEDDLPWEQEEEEEKPKVRKKTTATPAKKKTTTKAKTAPKTSAKKKEKAMEETTKRRVRSTTVTPKTTAKKKSTTKATAGTEVPKRRGRPPGSTNKPKPTTTEVKKRGRPPKSTAGSAPEAKKRGRPPTKKSVTSRKNTPKKKKAVPKKTDF